MERMGADKETQTRDRVGVEERICTPCQTKETREVQRLNRIGEAKNNKVTGIKSKGVYGVNEKITITAQGAWMDNKERSKVMCVTCLWDGR